jgi:hypothetical protein
MNAKTDIHSNRTVKGVPWNGPGELWEGSLGSEMRNTALSPVTFPGSTKQSQWTSTGWITLLVHIIFVT